MSPQCFGIGYQKGSRRAASASESRFRFLSVRSPCNRTLRFEGRLIKRSFTGRKKVRNTSFALTILREGNRLGSLREIAFFVTTLCFVEGTIESASHCMHHRFIRQRRENKNEEERRGIFGQDLNGSTKITNKEGERGVYSS